MSSIPSPIVLGNITISVVLPAESLRWKPRAIIGSTVFLIIPGPAAQDLARGLPSSRLQYGCLTHVMICILGTTGKLVDEVTLADCNLDVDVVLPASLRFVLDDQDAGRSPYCATSSKNNFPD